MGATGGVSSGPGPNWGWSQWGHEAVMCLKAPHKGPGPWEYDGATLRNQEHPELVHKFGAVPTNCDNHMGRTLWTG